MLEQVGNDAAIEDYFELNSPKFDSIEVSHIVLDSEGKAKEMISYLSDDPESFADMAREHSIADTRDEGGVIGRVLRGQLKPDIEAKVFNATVGDLLGPFLVGGWIVVRDFRGDGQVSGDARRRRGRAKSGGCCAKTG